MKNIKINKIIILILVIPTMFILQYYLFKFGVLSPQIKGVEITPIKGTYIKDIDKFVIKLNNDVIFSAGDYVKFPSYAEDPIIEFKNLDSNNKVKIENNSQNTVKITGIEEGLSSIAIVKNKKILKKFNILVVNPKILNLNTEIYGDLKYVGDKAVIKNYVEVDFERFNEKYKVNYKSTNQNILKIINNKIYATGIGEASIIASLDSKEEIFKYNIVAKLKSINVSKNISLKIGETKKIKATVITTPKNLKTPKIKYNFVENKLPIQRKIRLDNNGQIVGLRKGKEKLLISCGNGKNKVKKYITVTVTEDFIKK